MTEDEAERTGLLRVNAWYSGGKTREGAAKWLREAAARCRAQANKLESIAREYDDRNVG